MYDHDLQWGSTWRTRPETGGRRAERGEARAEMGWEMLSGRHKKQIMSTMPTLPRQRQSGPAWSPSEWAQLQTLRKRSPDWEREERAWEMAEATGRQRIGGFPKQRSETS